MDTASTTRDVRIAAWQCAVLVGLVVLAFLPVFENTVMGSFRGPEAAHGLAVIVMIGVLIRRRRPLLASSTRPGSVWGLVLVVLALLTAAVTTWPFSFAYPHRLAIAPALAGAVLAAAGWRVLYHALPMILLLLLAVPVSARYWAFLIIKPETLTLEFVRASLDLLPGVTARVNGLDLTYTRGGAAGSIALGEAQRGASLLLSFLTIGVFVTFYRLRATWKVVFAALAAGPVVLVANYARLLVRGIITIYLDADPLSLLPRGLSTVLALLLAWGLFAALLWLLDQVAPDPETLRDAAAPAPEPSS